MASDKFGRYEIRTELGKGGMATVYHAYDPRFKRSVALKILPREFMHTPMFLARFEREAQTIAALEHPVIVPVYDFGEDNGQPYLVMRHLAGGTLKERLERGPLSLKEISIIIDRMASALDEANSQGVVHRDLKPANILFDQRDNPYLSDFGIAKLAEASGTLTGSGVIGTPAYMSPEQARGEADIDGRSDIYALGAILFELLTGELPYSADTPMGIVVKHITEPVPRLSEFKPDLSSDFEDIISKAMAKAREDRYATAREMAAALNAATRAATSAPSPAVVSATLPDETTDEQSDVPATVVQTPDETAAEQPDVPATVVQTPDETTDEQPDVPATVVQTPSIVESPPPAVKPPSPVVEPPPPAVKPPPPVVEPPPPTPTPQPEIAPAVAPQKARRVNPLLIGGGVVVLIIVVIVGALGAGAIFGGNDQATEAPTAVADATSVVETDVTGAPEGEPTPAPDEPTLAPDAPTQAVDTPTQAPTDASEPTEIPVPEDMVLIPAGYFAMGSGSGQSNEVPVHPVLLNAYFIDIHEVTNASYSECVAAGGCQPGLSSSFTHIGYANDAAFANYPVMGVSWVQANAYCSWAGKALPTEAQWEYAARGADNFTWPWGNEFDSARLPVSVGDVQAVGSYPNGASPFGVLDMGGNVSEWVADIYDGAFYANSPPLNPASSIESATRIHRGGSFGNADGRFYMTSRRFTAARTYSDVDIGFRCAQVAPEGVTPEAEFDALVEEFCPLYDAYRPGGPCP